MKKIISLIVSVILTLTFAVPFAAADAPSVKITALNSFSVEFEYTGAGAESWVGVYADGETPGQDTPAIMWKKVTEGDGKGLITLSGAADGRRYGGDYTNLPAGKYSFKLFPDGGYGAVAEVPFEIKKYDFPKDDRYTYLSDLKPASWLMYEASSEDDAPLYTPKYDIQESGFEGNTTINVAGYYYEKGIRLHPGNETTINHLINTYDKYAEIVYDISTLDVNRFYTAAGKDSVGQKGWSMNFEILADGNLIYCSGEIGSRDAAIIDISIPAGTKLLTLRGMSFDGYNDDSFAFADAKVWKEDGAKTVTVKSVSLREITVSYTAAAADGKDIVGIFPAGGTDPVATVNLAAGDGEAKINLAELTNGGVAKLDEEKLYTVKLVASDGSVADTKEIFTPKAGADDTEPAVSADDTSKPSESSSAAPDVTSGDKKDGENNTVAIVIIAVAAVIIIAAVAVIALKNKKSVKKA